MLNFNLISITVLSYGGTATDLLSIKLKKTTESRCPYFDLFFIWCQYGWSLCYTWPAEKLNLQRDLKTVTMVYKSLSGLAPDHLKSMFTDRSTISNYPLSNCEGKLAVPLPRTNFLKTSFSYSSAMLWNISNEDLLERRGTEPMATILMRRRWRWIRLQNRRISGASAIHERACSRLRAWSARHENSPVSTHPQWPANHSVRKTVVITARCGPIFFHL